MENIPKFLVDTFSNMYLPKKKEKLADEKEASGEKEAPRSFTIANLIYIVLFFYAIYLSFKCHNGFNIWGFLGALVFGPFYVLYKLLSDAKKCGITTK
jgi:hypothetical protein